MGTFIQIIRWLFGIIFSLASIGGFLQREFAPATAMFIFGLLILPPVTKLIFRKRGSTSNSSFEPFSIFSRTKRLSKKIDCTGNSDIIQSIENVINAETKSLSSTQKRNLGELLYLKTLDNVLADFQISNGEKKRLELIKNYFGFNDNQIKSLNASRNQKAVKVLLSQKYYDKELTDIEKNEIVEFAFFLNLDNNIVEAIRRSIAVSILKSELNKFIVNKKLSPTGETYLKQLMIKLKLGDNIYEIGLPKSTIERLASCKKIWRADNGYLLPLNNTQIGLKKNEECYIMFPAKLVRSETVTAGYKSISHGFSMPLMKGVRYRAGTSYSMPVKENLTITHAGHIFLTDGRIIFIGGSESFDINFANGKLLSFEAYSNGIDFIISGWVYTIKFGSFLENLFSDNEMVDLLCSSLTSCMRYIQNPNDPVYHDAIKKVEENEELIKFNYD